MNKIITAGSVALSLMASSAVYAENILASSQIPGGGTSNNWDRDALNAVIDGDAPKAIALGDGRSGNAVYAIFDLPQTTAGLTFSIREDNNSTSQISQWRVSVKPVGGSGPFAPITDWISSNTANWQNYTHPTALNDDRIKFEFRTLANQSIGLVDIAVNTPEVETSPELESLLTNSNFENGDSGWNSFGGGNVITSSNAYSGDQLAYINGSGGVNQNVTLQANTDYTVSFQGSVAAAGQSYYVGVTNITTGNLVANTSVNSTAFTLNELNFTTSSNANHQYRIWMWNNAGGQYYVDDLTLTAAETPTTPNAIDSVRFADQNLQDCFTTAVNDNNWTAISDATSLYCAGHDISNTRGLEALTELQILNLTSAKLTAINVSQNTALIELIVSGNNLTSLNVSNNVNLEVLIASDNALTSINLGNNANLSTLGLAFNRLTTIDLTSNSALETLNIEANRLTALNVQYNTELTQLNAAHNRLTNINVNRNAALTELVLTGNNFSTINVRNNVSLEALDLTNMGLSGINLTANTALKNVDISDNNLSNINLRYNTQLEEVYLSGNALSNVNTSTLSALETLFVSFNTIGNVNITNNARLINLVIKANNLTGLNITSNNSLNFVNIKDNALSNGVIDNLKNNVQWVTD